MISWSSEAFAKETHPSHQMTETQKTKLVELARSLVGKPYKYGATPEEAPDYFDCSSFTQYLFKEIGIELPRSTIYQAAEGKTIVPNDTFSNLETGDLLFMHGTRGFYNSQFPQGIGHVILYIGDGKTIRAASERTQEKPRVVEVGAVEEHNLAHILEKYGPLIAVKRF